MQEAHLSQFAPPELTGFALISAYMKYAHNPLTCIEHLQRSYGPIVKARVGRHEFYLLSKPEHVRYLLTERPKNFTSFQSGQANGFDLLELLGEGLLTIEGETHRRQRRLVQPAFHKKQVEDYADVMVRSALKLMERWRPGDQVNMAKEMRELTLSVVARCIFNLELESEVRMLEQLLTQALIQRKNLLARLLNITVDLPWSSHHKRMESLHQINTFLYRLIEKRRAEGCDRGDVLSMLLALEDGEAMTDKQVRDHVMTLLTAGYDTTSSALTWALYLLSCNEGPCVKLQTELRTVLEGREPTVEDLAHLPYIEWVLNETLRLYPPGWITGRQAITAFDLDGYHFPAGSTLIMSQWLLHRHPEIWQEPERFRPERWNPQSGERVQPWSYFPFGGGPRICIGMPFMQMQGRLLLATILQRYSPRLLPGSHVEPRAYITLLPASRVPMILDPVLQETGETSPCSTKHENL